MCLGYIFPGEFTWKMLDLANKNQVVISTLHETVSSGTFNARMERYSYLLKYDIYWPYFWNTSEIFGNFATFKIVRPFSCGFNDLENIAKYDEEYDEEHDEKNIANAIFLGVHLLRAWRRKYRKIWRRTWQRIWREKYRKCDILGCSSALRMT